MLLLLLDLVPVRMGGEGSPTMPLEVHLRILSHLLSMCQEQERGKPIIMYSRSALLQRMPQCSSLYL